MRVLLVDDHPIFRHGLAMLLATLHPGLQIVQCASPGEWTALFAKTEDGAFDLALMDLHMPGFSDLHALNLFRMMAPQVPVVVLSGDESPETVQQCIELGAFGYVPKSAKPDVLIEALERIIGGGVWLPGSSLHIVNSVTSLNHSIDSDWSRVCLPVTARQRDVLQRVVQGKTNKVIARELGISDNTVKSHLSQLMNLLGVNTRTQIVYELARQGIRVDQIPVKP